MCAKSRTAEAVTNLVIVGLNLLPGTVYLLDPLPVRRTPGSAAGASNASPGPLKPEVRRQCVTTAIHGSCYSMDGDGNVGDFRKRHAISIAIIL